MRPVKNIIYPVLPNFYIRRYFKDKNVFYVLGMGRSGTRLLANLLNRGDGSRVFHEPVREDFQAIVRPEERYIKGRMKRVFQILKNSADGKHLETYGEVNSNLRYHGEALKSYFPDVTLIHNVRDGRDVVRSIMSRKHYTEEGEGHYNLTPLPEDPLFDRWGELSRFQKICWLWKDAVEKSEAACDYTVRFEEWTRQFDAFEKLLSLTGVEISKELWEEAMNTPNNHSPNYAIPHWSEWGEEKVKAFTEICGELMDRYDYSWR